MLHYETVLRLKAAEKETSLIGVIVSSGEEEYWYGCIKVDEDKEYIAYVASVFHRSFKKSGLVSNKKFKGKIKKMIYDKSYDESEGTDIEEALGIIVNDCRGLVKSVGEFTDLIDILDMIDYLEREKLDYLVFKEVK